MLCLSRDYAVKRLTPASKIFNTPRGLEAVVRQVQPALSFLTSQQQSKRLVTSAEITLLGTTQRGKCDSIGITQNSI